MSSFTLSDLWAEIRIELDAAIIEVDEDKSAQEFMDANELGLAYESLLRFCGTEKFHLHMEKAAQLMGFETV